MWNCQQTQDNKTDPNHIGPSVKYFNFKLPVIKWQLNFVLLCTQFNCRYKTAQNLKVKHCDYFVIIIILK